MLNYFYSFFDFFLGFWWIILPFLLTYFFLEKYFSNNLKTFVKTKIKYKFFEIVFPPSTLKKIQLMDEVFISLHSAAEPFSSPQQFFTGYFPLSYIFIIFFHDKNLKFIVGVDENKEKLLKNSFYSKYPEIKFIETQNPLSRFNFNLPHPLYSGLFFNIEIKSPFNVILLKTHKDIENLPEEERVDPASHFWEIKESITNKEWLFFIIYALPILTDDPALGKNWVNSYKSVIDSLVGKPKPPSPLPFSYYIHEFFRNLLIAPFKDITWTPFSSPPPPPFEFNIGKVPPENKDIIEKILYKIEKPGFLVSIKAVYLAKNDIFEKTSAYIPSLILSAFKNFAIERINNFSLSPLFKLSKNERFYDLKNFILTFGTFDSLKSHKDIVIKSKGLFKNDVSTSLSYVLNSEELSVIFHHPFKPGHPGFEKSEPPPFSLS